MTRLMLAPLLALSAAACTTAAEPPAADMPPVAVTTEAATLGPLRDRFEAGGVVTARTTAIVASRLSATVVSVDVAPGDRVRAGQRLIVLDGRDLDAHREQAVAAVAALEQAAAASVADRDAAGAALMLSRATHDRIAALHARRSATPQELDEAVSAWRGAEARLRAAEARVAEVDASLDSARAAATAAAVTASFAVLTAPFDGIVTEKLIEPGNLAAVDRALLRIEDTRSFRLETRVDESRVSGLAVGDPVQVLLGASGAGQAGSDEMAGRITEVSRAVDVASHAFLVKLDLPPDPRLRSGMFARARFGGETREALMVPETAIVHQGQLSTLFVVTDGRARMRVVRTGERDEGRVEVVAGLAPAELVIVPPPPDLRDGDLVATGTNNASGTSGGR